MSSFQSSSSSPLLLVNRGPPYGGPPTPREGAYLRAWEISDIEVSKKHNDDTSIDRYSKIE